tara:strand:- start:667 stop:831 length:165 start_codon:yes stop_codon:yes gene_type:complete
MGIVCRVGFVWLILLTGYGAQEVVIEEEPSREAGRKGLSAEVSIEWARELEKKG